jgi:hypothetical protein
MISGSVSSVLSSLDLLTAIHIVAAYGHRDRSGRRLSTESHHAKMAQIVTLGLRVYSAIRYCVFVFNHVLR